MCGEIEDWQQATTLTIRLGANAGVNIIRLNHIFEQVEEIRLDEIFLNGFNAGVNTSAYLQLNASGLSCGVASNEDRQGLLINYSSTNPQQIYSRPRTIAHGMTNLQHFTLTVTLPNGTFPVWTEVAFVLTVVTRRSADSLAEVRRMRHMMAMNTPQRTDQTVANSFRN